jgi:hypothetical protein
MHYDSSNVVISMCNATVNASANVVNRCSHQLTSSLKVQPKITKKLYKALKNTRHSFAAHPILTRKNKFTKGSKQILSLRKNATNTVAQVNLHIIKSYVCRRENGRHQPVRVCVCIAWEVYEETKRKKNPFFENRASFLLTFGRWDIIHSPFFGTTFRFLHSLCLQMVPTWTEFRGKRISKNKRMETWFPSINCKMSGGG